MSHVFISYVRDNKDVVDRLAKALADLGAEVWLDRNEIQPGTDWKVAIRRAIEQGDYFIACFSKAHRQRKKSEMNEELSIAIGELRKFQHDEAFFISVLLDECEVPDITVEAPRTLRNFQWVPLYMDWGKGIEDIAHVVIEPKKKIKINYPRLRYPNSKAVQLYTARNRPTDRRGQ